MLDKAQLKSKFNNMSYNNNTATAASSQQHEEWLDDNSQRIIAIIASEMEVHPDTVAAFVFRLAQADKWPSLAPDSLGYEQAYEALLRAAVYEYVKSIDHNKAYLQQVDAVGRYKARRMRTDATGRVFVDFSKGCANKRSRA